MSWFLFGVYVAGAAYTFVYVAFFCALGGSNEDLWRPFVYAIMWPFFVYYSVTGKGLPGWNEPRR